MLLLIFQYCFSFFAIEIIYKFTDVCARVAVAVLLMQLYINSPMYVPALLLQYCSILL
jgi:hypothetical protein